MRPLRPLPGLMARLPWLALTPASVLLVVAYRRAASGGPNDRLHFHLFWAAVLLFVLPAAVRMLQASVPASERLLLALTIGGFDYLPKLLRTPTEPMFHDELAHWRQARLAYETGHLFLANPTIGIIKYFPGLHGLTAALSDISGLHSFRIGLVIIGVAHLLGLGGVFLLAETALGSTRVAGVAAVVYSLNPSYLFFDAQYSYESLAIVFYIWVLVCAIRMVAADSGSGRLGWGIAGGLLASASIVTHHLTTYVLAENLVLASMVTAFLVYRRREPRHTLVLVASFTVMVIAGMLAWLVLIAPQAAGYLTHSLAGGASDLVHILNGQTGARKLFSRSATPFYERLCAFLSPILALIGAGVGLLLLRRRRWPSAPAMGIAAFGLLYFPSMPLILTARGAEGAGRTWAFTYLGLSLLAAPALVAITDGTVRLRFVPVPVRRLRKLLVVAALGVVFVGNVAMLTSPDYRFPGPFIFGSDTRSLTPELIHLTNWFERTQGHERLVVSDRYTGLALAGLGDAWTASPSLGFRVWELYFNLRPSRLLLNQLRTSGYEYVIVDRRMYQALPEVGVYFEPDEPAAYERTKPPPRAALSKFDDSPWMTRIYESDNLAVYRLDFDALGMPKAPSRCCRRVP